jgi:hypothetical protein
MKQKEEEREKDSGETEKERCERGMVPARRRSVSSKNHR